MCVIVVHLIDEDKDAKQETIIENKNKTSFFFHKTNFFTNMSIHCVDLTLIFYNEYICSDDQLCCFSFEENSNAKNKTRA
jgi:hypothetical protein